MDVLKLYLTLYRVITHDLYFFNQYYNLAKCLPASELSDVCKPWELGVFGVLGLFGLFGLLLFQPAGGRAFSPNSSSDSAALFDANCCKKILSGINALSDLPCNPSSSPSCTSQPIVFKSLFQVQALLLQVHLNFWISTVRWIQKMFLVSKIELTRLSLIPNGTNPSLQFSWQMALCLKSLSSQSQNPLLESSGGIGHDRISSSPSFEFYILDRRTNGR